MASRVGLQGGDGAWVLPAPAKLNLFLHVVGRRDDGYHLLQTVFQLLDWGDRVSLRLRRDGVLRMVEPTPGVVDEDNLALRAARAFKAATEGEWGVDIDVDKQIPMGGGLGGASSDAATVLVGLNALTGSRFDLDSLAAIGLDLGADVPVFVRGHSAWAEGVGDHLVPIDLPERWFLLIHPGVPVSTTAVFCDPGLTRNTPPVTISGFLNNSSTSNDLERVAIGLAPEVGTALEWLSRFSPARMTGSGSCVFASFDARTAAEAVAARVPGQWSAHVARGVAHSPLHEAIRNFQAVT